MMMSINIEKAIIHYLSARLDVEVYADVPSPRPPRCVVVERTGGALSDIVIDLPMIAVQCWGTSRHDAATLAYEVDMLLPCMTEIEGVSKVSRNSLYNFPDENGKGARYQLVFDFVTT